jgi:hypothetical protein
MAHPGEAGSSGGGGVLCFQPPELVFSGVRLGQVSSMEGKEEA